MLNAGFQYLEQRDANDTITKEGVVGKNSPFATIDDHFDRGDFAADCAGVLMYQIQF